MANSLNWEKVNRERSVYRPAPDFLPPTTPQLDYIKGLSWQKEVAYRRPITRGEARLAIDTLKLLPDMREYRFVRNGRFIDEPLAKVEPVDGPRKEVLAELRNRFPVMSPMTVNALVQLIEQVDPIGGLFFLDSIMHEDTPAPIEELLPYILARFVEEFAPVKG